MSVGDKDGQQTSLVDLAVRKELIFLIFGSPSVPLINGVAILMTAGVLWRNFPLWISLSWLIVSLCVVLLRLMLWLQFGKGGAETGHIEEWSHRLILITAVVGGLWGLTASTVFVAPDLIYSVFVAFVVGGLSAGAAIRYSPHPPAVYAFIGSAATPLVFALLLHGQLISTAMGALLLVFFVVMIAVGRENHQRLADYIRMKLEQEALNANLQKVTLDLTEQNAVLSERSELLDNAQDAIFVQDMNTRILYWNKGAERLFGWTEKEVMGRRVADVFPDDRGTIREAFDQVAELGRWSGELPKRDKQGRRLTVASRCTVVRTPGGEPRAILVVNTDVTEQKISRARIQHLAYYDGVTGLPNRVLLRERLQNAIETYYTTGQNGALLFIDMDDFKTLNDTAGHDVGDLLLQQIAIRLKSAVRGNDCVARFGGDEFVVMLEGLGTNSKMAARRAQAIGREILQALRGIYHLRGYEYQGTASVGITLIGKCSDKVDDLLKRADLAMYHSKAQGRNTICVFDPDMERDASARAALLADLRRALLSGEFELLYQPQLDSDGTVVGCEALVRWHHPQRGMIPPTEFIPLAESGGMIVELGAWVLGEACRRLATWSERPGLSALTIAVNVSSKQFLSPHFVHVVEDVLRSTGIDPRRLKLEITESAAMEKVSEAIEKMMTLKAFGIQFSLDDFGTGYSSLSQLKLLPLDQLKIDKSFVRGVLESVSDASIVRTIIDLGRNLNLQVIAEGVETAEQRDFLKSQGCRTFQGFLFSVPLSAVALEEFAIGNRLDYGDGRLGLAASRAGEMSLSGEASATCDIPEPWPTEEVACEALTSTGSRRRVEGGSFAPDRVIRIN